jgi:sulfopropanediol 3-dehydrogenase
MADVLKGAAETPATGDARVRRVVSEMLLRIELGGDRVVREYSRALDGWDPPEFRVGANAIERASAQLSAELTEHIAFALAQVRAFAARQRETMTDLRVETLPGMVLGHRHVPVAAAARTSPAAATRCSRRRS